MWTPPRRGRGFSLLELLVVVALLAVASAGIGLALRDTESDRLRAEAERLAHALDSARSLARAAALPVRWRPSATVLSAVTAASAPQFAFIGLPAAAARELPTRWLGEAPQLTLTRSNPAAPDQPGTPVDSLWLGPEALIPPQQVQLHRGSARWQLRTDGAGPFVVESVP